jgi:hypothetical protein
MTQSPPPLWVSYKQPSWLMHLKLKIPLTHKKPIWWNEEVLEARRALRTAHHLWQKQQSPLLHEAYIELCSKFQKVLIVAKKSGWPEFTPQCTNPVQTSKLARAILTKKSPPVGLHKMPNAYLLNQGRSQFKIFLSLIFQAQPYQFPTATMLKRHQLTQTTGSPSNWFSRPSTHSNLIRLLGKII